MNTTPPPILTVAEMRACDTYTILKRGVPSRILMEQAARAVAACLLRREDLFPAGRVVCLCGSGNNGGDGFAAARFLSDGSMSAHREVCVLYTGRTCERGDGSTETIPDTRHMSEECARQYRLATEAGVPVIASTAPEDVERVLDGASCVMDAIFGIGLDRPVVGDVRRVMEAVISHCLPVLAVDIPSGVGADDGAILGLALPARATVTMQALKAGLVLYPGADICGDLIVADIGIDLTPAPLPFAWVSDETLLRRVLPPKRRRSHKGTYGRVVMLVGSVGMSGAAVLAARAALRCGAGLVEVVTPNENRVVLQAAVPEAIVTTYDAHASTPASWATQQKILRESIRRANCVLAGCGLGVSDTVRMMFQTVLDAMPIDGHIPLVLDADALNLLASDDGLWETEFLSSPERQVIITPHPMEMARLLKGNREILSILLSDTAEAAMQYARTRGITVVLKDAHTVTASPSKDRYICLAGNAGMATGGSGDVLAGVIASLLGQTFAACAQTAATCSVADVAAAGVYLHAAAGDRTAEQMGEYGMLPSDLIERIPLVLQDFSQTRTHLETV